MIRIHMASFPPRRAVLGQALASLAGQADRIVLCLNGYEAVPPEIAALDGVEALIPPRDLKDAGKFLSRPAPGDVVLTCDDDILYPPDYVARTLAAANLAAGPAGYQAHSWVWKPREARMGWRNFMYWKRRPKALGVHMLGTGTAVMLGRDVPPLDAIEGAAGFVDTRLARLSAEAGRPMTTLARQDEWIARNMPEGLRATSLYETVGRRMPPALKAETVRLLVAVGAAERVRPPPRG